MSTTVTTRCTQICIVFPCTQGIFEHPCVRLVVFVLLVYRNRTAPNGWMISRILLILKYSCNQICNTSSFEHVTNFKTARHFANLQHISWIRLSPLRHVHFLYHSVSARKRNLQLSPSKSLAPWLSSIPIWVLLRSSPHAFDLLFRIMQYQLKLVDLGLCYMTIARLVVLVGHARCKALLAVQEVLKGCRQKSSRSIKMSADSGWEGQSKTWEAAVHEMWDTLRQLKTSG